MDKEKNKNKKVTKSGIKELFSLIKQDKKTYFFAIFLRIIAMGISLYITIILGKMVDGIVKGNYDLFTSSLKMFFAFSMTSLFLNTVGLMNIALLTQNIMYKLRRRLNRHIQFLPIRKFEEKKSGELISLFSIDMEQISVVLDQSLVGVFIAGLEILVNIIFIIYLNYILGLISAFTAFCIMALVFNFGKKVRKYSKKRMESYGEIYSYIEEIVSNQVFVKIYNYEEKAKEDYHKKAVELKRYSITSGLYKNLIEFISSGGINLLNAVVIGLGSYLAFNNLLEIASLTMILKVSANLIEPITRISTETSRIYEGIASSERMFKTLDSEEEVDKGNISIINEDGIYYWYNEKQKIHKTIKGEIEFKNVSYEYKDEIDNIEKHKGKENKFSISNLNFKIKENETLAIVGKTGAGKSTITNLITRFYEIDEGSILIDGIDVRDIRKKDLRKVISMVIQDINLFSGTVYENIRYGNLKITKEEVLEIANKLGVMDIIGNFKDGIDTNISKDDQNISEGEKQVISVLRAAVSNPNILILDEATSKVDTLTEEKIQEGINILKQNTINIVIAHRLSTIRSADYIMVLSNGSIVEMGNHEELYNKKGLYYSMIETGKNDFDLK